MKTKTQSTPMLLATYAKPTVEVIDIEETKVKANPVATEGTAASALTAGS